MRHSCTDVQKNLTVADFCMKHIQVLKTHSNILFLPFLCSYDRPVEIWRENRERERHRKWSSQSGVEPAISCRSSDVGMPRTQWGIPDPASQTTFRAALSQIWPHSSQHFFQHSSLTIWMWVCSLCHSLISPASFTMTLLSMQSCVMSHSTSPYVYLHTE